MYELTGEEVYLDFGHKLFNGYTRLKGNHDIWICRLDSIGYYWLEEYPHDDNPGQTLNGFVFSLYGLYDYCRLTGNPEARRIFDLGITTLKQYAPYFRQKDTLSFYCLGHRSVANPGYHALHADQMGFLQIMTGDPFFAIMRQIFIDDADALSAP